MDEQLLIAQLLESGFALIDKWRLQGRFRGVAHLCDPSKLDLKGVCQFRSDKQQAIISS